MININGYAVKVLDSHTHFPSPEWSGNTSFFGTVEKAMDYLRETGTDGAMFNTWQGVLGKTDGDVEQANASALKLMEKYPGILYPGAVVHPDFFEISRQWLERFRERKLMWVGELILESHSYRYVDAPYLKLMEECAKHGHIVQLHGHADIIELAKRFPQTQFVVSHLQDDSVMTQIAEQPNLWQDISGFAAGLCTGRLERALEILGPDRLLYGTDFDGYEPRAFIARVCTVVKDLKDCENIFSRNLLRLLSLADSKPF